MNSDFFDHPIAIVEDQLILREEMAFQLSRMGFAVECFANASELYRRLAVSRFDAIILDIGLEGEDGLSICDHLRKHDRELGIIFCTARGLRDDRIKGLNLGADAYLVKPVDIDEVSLILTRLLERKYNASKPQELQNHTVCKEWKLDKKLAVLSTSTGISVRLSLTESQLLTKLMTPPNVICVHNELAFALGILPEEFNKHRIEVIISRLRDKVKRETGIDLPLINKRGHGYIFQAD